MRVLAGRRERELLDLPSVARMAAVLAERCREPSWIRTLVASLDRFGRLSGHDDLEALLAAARTDPAVADRALADLARALDGHTDAAVAALAMGPKVWFRLGRVPVAWRPLPAATAARRLPDRGLPDPAERALILVPIGSGLGVAEVLRLRIGDVGSIDAEAHVVPDLDAEPFAVHFEPRRGRQPAAGRFTFLSHAARAAVLEHVDERRRRGHPIDGGAPLLAAPGGGPLGRAAVARARTRANAIIRAGSNINVDLCRTTGEFFREWGLPGSRFEPADRLVARDDVGGDPVCWLDRVCDECGAFVDDAEEHVCRPSAPAVTDAPSTPTRP
jgi:hypothetical protein